jgi:hypothetical protein
MLVFLIVSIFVLSALALPARAAVELRADVLKNDGYIALKLFGAKVFRAKLRFENDPEEHNNSIVLKSGKKRDEIHLNADKEDKKSVVALLNHPSLENLKIHSLDLTLRVGKADDAFFTTVALGTVKVALFSFLGYLKSRYGTHIRESFLPEYNADEFTASARGIISISIADIIISYAYDGIKRIAKKFKTEDKKIDSRTH